MLSNKQSCTTLGDEAQQIRHKALYNITANDRGEATNVLLVMNPDTFSLECS